jgi:PAS domain S-box-containing protein
MDKNPTPDLGEPPNARPDNRIHKGFDQFRLMTEAILDYAIFMLDPNGNIVTWNGGAERIKGYKASEIIGRHFSILYPQEDLLNKKPQWELEVAAREGRFEDEGWRLRKDGTKFWANVIITAIRDEDRQLIGFGKVTRDFTERKEQNERLRQSEERFRLLVEGVPDYAIYMMDPDGKITTWNSGAEKIKGYTAAEIIGKPYSTFFLEEDVRANKPQQILETAVAHGHAAQEGWRRRKDGSRFWVNSLVTALHDRSGKLIGFSKITRDITEKMEQQRALQNEIVEKEKAQRQLRKSEESLRQLSLNLLRTQDEERRRIGREMHDSLGQYLGALKMKLEMLRLQDKNLSPATTRELAQCSALLHDCLKEVRTISYLLYPPMLEEMGLKSAVRWYLDGFTERSGIQTSFTVSDRLQRMPRDIELALFRVLQEALTNVHKHSASAKVDLRLLNSDGNVTLEVRDFGKGLSDSMRNQLESSWYALLGVGLRGMHERIQQLGGTLNVESAAPGTLVRATVPTHVLDSKKVSDAD